MKYNININQIAINELAPELNILDAAILSYLIDICNSKSEKIEYQRIKEDNEIWTWVDFENLLKNMPLLNLSARSSLTPKFKKLSESGFISIKRKSINGHIRMFIKLNEKVDSLFMKMNVHVHENERETPKHVHENEPIINTINTTINTNTLEGKSFPSSFLAFYEAYPKHEGRDAAFRAFKKINDKILPKLFEALEYQKRTKADMEVKFWPMPATWLNQKRWEDEMPKANSKEEMEEYARWCVKKWEKDDGDNAQFEFLKKYKTDDLLKVKHIINL